MDNLPDNRIYYAQNREDLILEAFFPDLKKGFYVDVGACHPQVASVTKRFYLNGWHGINIEPQTNLYGLFVSERERDINLNIGIANKESTIVLRVYKNNQGLSTASPDIKDEYEGTEGNKTEEYEDTKVRVMTLNSVLSKNKVKSIQFLKVDVEGYEYEVLEGNDWEKFRPEVICIEANHILKDWRPLLKKNDYAQVFFDGLNEYYVDSRTDRGKKFNFVDHVVMNLEGGIAVDDFEERQKLEAEVADSKNRLDNASVELQSLKKLLPRTARLTLSRTKKLLKKDKRNG